MITVSPDKQRTAAPSTSTQSSQNRYTDKTSEKKSDSGIIAFLLKIFSFLFCCCWGREDSALPVLDPSKITSANPNATATITDVASKGLVHSTQIGPGKASDSTKVPGHSHAKKKGSKKSKMPSAPRAAQSTGSLSKPQPETPIQVKQSSKIAPVGNEKTEFQRFNPTVSKRFNKDNNPAMEKLAKAIGERTTTPEITTNTTEYVYDEPAVRRWMARWSIANQANLDQIEITDHWINENFTGWIGDKFYTNEPVWNIRFTDHSAFDRYQHGNRAFQIPAKELHTTSTTPGTDTIDSGLKLRAAKDALGKPKS